MDIYRLILNINDINPVMWVILVICLLLSSFFSASETALSTLTTAKITSSVEEGERGARKAFKLHENFEDTISTILIGNNIVNIGMATIAARVAAELIKNPNMADIISTLVTTLVVLIFGEILPKAFAKSHPTSVAYRAAGILSVLSFLFKPFNVVFLSLTRLLSSKEDDQPSVTENELEAIVNTMEEEGVIEGDESSFIKAILDLNDKTVEDIMVPRVDMIAVDVEEDVNQIKNIFFEHKFSRIPVFQDDKDNIIGILYERDFFTKLLKNQKVNIKKTMRPVKFVSRWMKVDDLIQDLRKSNVHIAIVSGEYGETAGLVTMEDALEQIVGDIYDEHDEVHVEQIIKITDDEYEVDANIELDELFETLKIGNEPETQSAKLSGWLYELNEDIPEMGDQVIYDSKFLMKDEDNDYQDFHKRLTFTIKEVGERRIKKVFLKIENIDTDEEEE